MPFSPNEIFDLSGRTALVTGSSRGIGAAIARALAAAGARVCVHGQSETSAAATLAAITADGGHGEALFGDLATAGTAKALVETCERRCGQLDILVVNASAQINAKLEELTFSDLSCQLDVNLRSTVELLQTCLPLMAARGWGRVVNIGSINQSGPKPQVTAYAATKAAQHNLIQSQARAYARSGVVLNTLAPGLIDTDRNAALKSDPNSWEGYVDQANWMGRAGQPADLIGTALLLSSNACSFMTGEVVTLSGGY